jgi:hypothetical protein
VIFFCFGVEIWWGFFLRLDVSFIRVNPSRSLDCTVTSHLRRLSSLTAAEVWLLPKLQSGGGYCIRSS